MKLRTQTLIIMNTLKNYVQLIGHLGNNPELKIFDSGKKKTSVSLATNEVYKNKQGEQVKTTQWHRLVAWGSTAESMGRFLQKGSEIAIQGKLTHRSYQDAKGETKYITEVVVNEFINLSKKSKEDQVPVVAEEQAQPF